jgi:hypothetical protein
MTDQPAYYGEDGFSAQDQMPLGIQVSEDQAARLADLEHRQAAIGRDIFGGPLPGEVA